MARIDICPECCGEGIAGDGLMRCHACEGTGIVTVDEYLEDYYVEEERGTGSMRNADIDPYQSV